jgi:hypothetical protein
MQLTFVQLARFASRWAQFKLTDEDLQALERTLLRNPNAGAVVAGTGGLRKVRLLRRRGTLAKVALSALAISISETRRRFICSRSIQRTSKRT